MLEHEIWRDLNVVTQNDARINSLIPLIVRAVVLHQYSGFRYSVYAYEESHLLVKKVVGWVGGG